jgi:hypothetical protein
VLGAEVEHLLGLGEATGKGSGEGTPASEKGEHCDGRGSDGAPTLTIVPFLAQQLQIGVEVDGAETVLIIGSKVFASWSKVSERRSGRWLRRR